MSVLAKDRKEKPFRCQQQAEAITGLLIDDVLESLQCPCIMSSGMRKRARMS